jgi:hypothetical protein
MKPHRTERFSQTHEAEVSSSANITWADRIFSSIEPEWLSVRYHFILKNIHIECTLVLRHESETNTPRRSSCVCECIQVDPVAYNRHDEIALQRGRRTAFAYDSQKRTNRSICCVSRGKIKNTAVHLFFGTADRPQEFDRVSNSKERDCSLNPRQRRRRPTGDFHKQTRTD